jgi:hypothetical protein
MHRSIAAFLLLVLFGYSLASAGDWQVARTEGDTLQNCELVGLQDSMLVLKKDGTTMSISIDSVAAMSRHVEGSGWLGGGIGAVAGCVVGAAIASTTYHPSPSHGFRINVFGSKPFVEIGGGLLGFAVGGAVGGALGQSLERDIVVQFSGRSRSERIEMVKRLMEL